MQLVHQNNYSSSPSSQNTHPLTATINKAEKKKNPLKGIRFSHLLSAMIKLSKHLPNSYTTLQGVESAFDGQVKFLVVHEAKKLLLL